MHLQFSISGFMFPFSVSDNQKEERPKGNPKPQRCRSKESSSSNSKKTNPKKKDCHGSCGGDKHHNEGGEEGRRLRLELKTDDNSEKVGPREHFIASKSPVKRVPPCNLSVKSPLKRPSWVNSPLKRASPYKIFRRKGHFCKYCPIRQKFSSRLELLDHIKEKHMEEGDKQFLCNTCSKTFISKRGLDKHSAFHTANLFCRFCKLKLADIKKKKLMKPCAHREQSSNVTCVRKDSREPAMWKDINKQSMLQRKTVTFVRLQCRLHSESITKSVTM